MGFSCDSQLPVALSQWSAIHNSTYCKDVAPGNLSFPRVDECIAQHHRWKTDTRQKNFQDWKLHSTTLRQPTHQLKWHPLKKLVIRKISLKGGLIQCRLLSVCTKRSQDINAWGEGGCWAFFGNSRMKLMFLKSLPLFHQRSFGKPYLWTRTGTGAAYMAGTKQGNTSVTGSMEAQHNDV